MLVLAHRLPYPLDDGSKTRTYHVLRALLARAEVTLVTFHDGGSSIVEDLRASLPQPIEVRTVPTPRRYSPLQLLLGLLTRRPVYLWRFATSRAFAAEVERVARTKAFDWVVSQLTYMYPYVELVPGARRAVDTHNIDSQVLERYARWIRNPLQRLYARITAGKLRRYEARVFAEADRVWVCSADDAELARRLAPTAAVEVVPNGVDTRRMAPLTGVSQAPRRLLFFGRMDYLPNVDAVRFFVEDLLPEIRRRCGEVELEVVGAGIGRELHGLSEGEPALRLTGRVEDLRPVLAAATAIVVPLRIGGGTRLKILEALAMGKAVISTSIGAEGLRLDPGAILIADTPDEFAAAVQRVLDDASVRERLEKRGRAAVVDTYDWDIVAEAVSRTMEVRCG